MENNKPFNPLKIVKNSSAIKIIKVEDVKVDNPIDIANNFYEFFCNVGQLLADKVNRTDNENPIKYLKNRINESVFLISSIYLQEINRIKSS